MALNMGDDQGSLQGEHNIQHQERDESNFSFPIMDTTRDCD